MKYSVVTAFSLLLGSGVAAAQANTEPAPQQQPAYEQQPTYQPPQQPSQAAPAPTEQTEVAPVDLLFDTAKWDLPSDARSKLIEVATWAKCNPRGAVILEGHADIRGSQPYNMVLSGERAAAVKQKLIRLGVPASRIVVTAYGKNGPRRGSLQADRRVTVRATARPVPEGDITAQR